MRAAIVVATIVVLAGCGDDGGGATAPRAHRDLRTGVTVRA